MTRSTSKTMDSAPIETSEIEKILREELKNPESLDGLIKILSDKLLSRIELRQKELENKLQTKYL